MINSQASRQQLANDISATFSKLEQVLSGFDPEILNKVPFAGSWTAGQVAEHIIKSTDGLPDNSTRPSGRQADQQVQAIKDMFLDFTVKFKADPFLHPTKNSYEKGELLAALEKIEGKLQHIALTADLEALCLDMELPVFGYMTRYEWLRFIMYHTQRHIHQLENIYDVAGPPPHMQKEV